MIFFLNLSFTQIMCVLYMPVNSTQVVNMPTRQNRCALGWSGHHSEDKNVYQLNWTEAWEANSHSADDP
jgi:hypothetical protein